MANFRFNTSHNKLIGGVRIDEKTHHKIKSIAQQKEVSLQEVVRVFIDYALQDFEKEYPEHFDVIHYHTEGGSGE